MTPATVDPGIFDSVDALRAAGFEGFWSVSDLARSGSLEVPVARGVYLVVRDSGGPPKFMPGSAAGMFRGQKASVKVEVLEPKWVPGAIVLYVGVAGGTGVRNQLQQRIKRMIRFGSGKSIAAWGGRYVWQLADHRRLLLAWRTVEEPAGDADAILAAFQSRYGAMPFANLPEDHAGDESAAEETDSE